MEILKAAYRSSRRCYTNLSLITAEIVSELVTPAKQMRDGQSHHHELELRNNKVAFYAVIVQNDAAVLPLGKDVPKEITQRITKAVRDSATLVWNFKDPGWASMRSKVRRARYNCPPDAEAKATILVLEMAELFARRETESGAVENA